MKTKHKTVRKAANKRHNMGDQLVLTLLHRFKVSKGEWAEGHRPTVQELSTALRAMGRLDVASRVEEGRTVYALKD